MQFTSIPFALFVLGLLAVYYLVPGRAQWAVLLAASWAYYLWAGPRYLGLLLFTVAATYLVGRVLGRNLQRRDAALAAMTEKAEKTACKARTKRVNRRWLAAYLAVMLGMLALCKALLLEPLARLAAGTGLSFLSVMLPLGISYYLFLSVGYAVDVHRGVTRAEGNVLKLALFISFFPQLVQGPISKYAQVAPQLTAPHKWEGKTVSFGLQRMLWGYFKKLVIADRIAPAVLALRGGGFGGSGFFLLAVFYTLQLYGDFTGGIDITLGLAQSLGVALPENFRRPFFAKNLAEYWRRWHISLSAWMKDYVFYPLSVSGPLRSLTKAARRRSPGLAKRLPVYVASTVTWLATGVWHGFTPNFALWGLMNCVVILASEELQPLYSRFHGRFRLKEKALYGVFERVRLFLLVSLMGVVDLFPDVGGYWLGLGSLFAAPNLGLFADGTLAALGLTGLDWGILALGTAACFGVSLWQERRGSLREALWEKTWLRYGLVFLLLVAVLLLGSYGIGYDAGNFIYNQF